MGRSVLSQGKRLNRGPRRHAEAVPAITVLLGSALAILPVISETGWWPDWGLLILVAWRMLRADAWPAWWAAPLGFFNDLVTDNPIGLSIATWSAIMIVMDFVDRRTQWRDYWIEWAVAALLIAAAEVIQWRIAAISGATLPFAQTAGPAIIVAALCFPLAALMVAKVDRWRLRP